MKVPEEIRAIERPRNTIVVPSVNGRVYAVRARAGTRREGKRSFPINGPVIGHIRDGRYIPLDEDSLEKNRQEKKGKRKDPTQEKGPNAQAPEKEDSVTLGQSDSGNGETVTEKTEQSFKPFNITLRMSQEAVQKMLIPYITWLAAAGAKIEEAPSNSPSREFIITI